MTQSAPVPPIGTQISALAELAPDEAAVTCEGHTLTRAELDRSTNRLARAYAERGVGVGDYVTMVLPNSIEWIQAAVACWKLGAVPQPLSRPIPVCPMRPCPKPCRRCGRRWGPAAAPAGQSSSNPAATAAYRPPSDTPSVRRRATPPCCRCHSATTPASPPPQSLC